MLTFVRSSSSVLVMISSMSVPICNHLHARQAGLGPLISKFYAENLICWLSWSTSSHFGAIHP